MMCVFFGWLTKPIGFDLIISVTAVESGSRALQYLGLDGDKSSVGSFDVSKRIIAFSLSFFFNFIVVFFACLISEQLNITTMF